MLLSLKYRAKITRTSSTLQQKPLIRRFELVRGENLPFILLSCDHPSFRLSSSLVHSPSLSLSLHSKRRIRVDDRTNTWDSYEYVERK